MPLERAKRILLVQPAIPVMPMLLSFPGSADAPTKTPY